MLNLSGLNVRHKTCGCPAEAARCPQCGIWSPRNEIRHRYFWEPDLRQPTVTEVLCGCYLCPACPEGQRWFVVAPPEFRTRRQYSATAQRFAVDLVRKHGLSVEQAAAAAQDMFHLPELQATTILSWLRAAGDAVDSFAHVEAAVEAFSGQMALDEVYDGEWYVIKATDPLNDVELGWVMGGGSPSDRHMRAFLLDLKAAGFHPKLVVTDGSSLYPNVIAEVWPDAKHQRCVFHFIKQLNENLRSAFWAAYHTMPKPPKRKRGRPKKRGRPRKDKEKRDNRRKVRAARYLLLKRENLPGEKDRWTDRERTVLAEAIALCPPLGVLRRFVVQHHELFGPTTDSHELAEQRRKAILDDHEFNAVEALAKPLERLRDDDLFERLTRYLDFDNADKTSNHVERENREIRKRQKAHYRFRSLESLCALLQLLTVRKPVPGKPTKLVPSACSQASDEEVRQAA